MNFKKMLLLFVGLKIFESHKNKREHEQTWKISVTNNGTRQSTRKETKLYSDQPREKQNDRALEKRRNYTVTNHVRNKTTEHEKRDEII